MTTVTCSMGGVPLIVRQLAILISALVIGSLGTAERRDS
jgi:hypothetical protein